MNKQEVHKWIKENDRLIKAYVAKFIYSGYTQEDFDDLYNEAVYTILKRYHCYKPEKGLMSTYLYYVLGRALLRYQRSNKLKMTYPKRILDSSESFKLYKENESKTIFNIPNDEWMDRFVLTHSGIDNPTEDYDIDTSKFKKLFKRIYTSSSDDTKLIIGTLYNLSTLERKPNISKAELGRRLGVTTSYIQIVEERFVKKFKDNIKRYKYELLKKEDY